MRLRYGYDYFIAKLLLSVPVEEFRKSVTLHLRDMDKNIL